MRHGRAALKAVLLVACVTLAAAQCGPNQDMPYPEGTTECPTGGGGGGGGGDASGGGMPAFTRLTGQEDADSCGVLEGSCGNAGQSPYVSRSLAYDKATGKLIGTITTNQ